MKTTKGQAAMEFLMTYGWAILGYYYFSRDVLTPKAAVINPPFYLNAQVVNTTGVSLDLKNNGDDTVTISEVNIDNCADQTGLSVAIASGGNEIITVDCVLNAGDTFKGTITVYYTKASSTLTQTSTGSITQSVA